MLIKDDLQWKGDGGSLSNLGFWDLKLRAQIGRDLRTQYEETMDEPLPERLATLLERLEQQERGE
ncbi:hypothetical protein AA309_10150 [Microvirga vignae]|uniref:Anti-sigma factor NepR domain-containing protein n=1 Tax=Microvirga vignae TaxID=1225564 RepID=A0A0H1RD74_9HYPH|nr:NepR family anti-sigma factor [Microvirga vignae]KLK93153.1 hypothetical protein AA309_10150 [Microvirga vignae]